MKIDLTKWENAGSGTAGFYNSYTGLYQVQLFKNILVSGSSKENGLEFG